MCRQEPAPDDAGGSGALLLVMGVVDPVDQGLQPVELDQLDMLAIHLEQTLVHEAG